MRGSALPAALLCAVVALALAAAPRRTQGIALGLFIACAIAALAACPIGWVEAAFAGCWIGILIVGATIYIPRPLSPWVPVTAAVLGGIGTGAVVAVGGTPADLARALPALLLLVPATWLSRRGWGIALKVATSWAIAVALLAALLPASGTDPGYQPDHME